MPVPLPDAAASGAACARPQFLACPAPDAVAASAFAYTAACPARPPEAPYPAAMAAASRDAPACAYPDAPLPASLRAAGQMIFVGPRVRHQSHLVRPTAKDRVVHLAPLALDVSVAPDGVHLAADFPLPFPEAVRGPRQSALADAPELLDG